MTTYENISSGNPDFNSGYQTAADLAFVSGFAVFPCKHDKTPLTQHGFKDATTDPDLIRSWWTQWPDALVGVPTGARNGFDALDIDPRHDGDKWYQENLRRLPATRAHQTRGGGLHLLYKSRPGLRGSAGTLAPGIDVRAEGGYVIWWSALHEQDMCDWPEWLLEQQKKQGETESESSSQYGQTANLLDVAAALVAIPNFAKEHRASWDAWNDVALATFGATGGSDAGYQLFLEWCRPHPTFNEAKTRARWEQMTGCPPDKKGAGSLFHYAREATLGWQIPSHIRNTDHGFTGEMPEDQQARRAALIRRLSINSWIARDIAPADRLLGDLLTTTARVFLVGRTGLGKTNLAVAIAVSVATGTGFMHWHCARPGRVLYLDGEMSPELIKGRASDAARRLGKPIPDGSMLIYSAVDGEAFASEFPELGVMPPLNTPAGHEWVKRLIDIGGGFDLVVLDNVMSLIEGDNKDEVSWSGVLPLVNWLSANRIGQLWLDHTGHNETRQYGASAKAWRFDASGIMSPVDGDADPEGNLSFQLSFDHPGKARRRTPENRRDFQTVKITLSEDGWHSAPVTARDSRDNQKLTPSEAKWLADIRDVFTEQEAAATETLSGLMEASIGPRRMHRDAVRDALKEMDCFALKTSGGLTDSARKEWGRLLRILQRKGKIGMDEEMLWLE
jgi:hypothetical protein